MGTANSGLTEGAASRPPHTDQPTPIEQPPTGEQPTGARAAGVWLDGLMVGAFVALTAALELDSVRRLDLGVRDWVDGHRPGWAEFVAQNLNRLGQGGLLTSLCVLLAAAIAWRRRSWSPFAPVAVAFVVTGVVIEPIKLIFGRAAPHAGLADEVAVRLFGQPEGVSYPSGHAVNALVWYAVIALLLDIHARWLRVIPPVVVTLAGTYLGYHWFTDMLAGVALGVPMARLVTHVFTRRGLRSRPR